MLANSALGWTGPLRFLWHNTWKLLVPLVGFAAGMELGYVYPRKSVAIGVRQMTQHEILLVMALASAHPTCPLSRIKNDPSSGADKAFHFAHERLNRIDVQPPRYPWPIRLFAWVLMAFLMPLLASPLAQCSYGLQTNTIKLVLVLELAGFAGAGSYCLLGFCLDAVPAASFLVLGTATSLLYNWIIVWKLDDLRG
jgi:hypothetical protein